MSDKPNVTPSEAAAALGRIKSDKKTEAARQNARKPRRPLTEETKAKIRAAWARKRGEEQAETE